MDPIFVVVMVAGFVICGGVLLARELFSAQARRRRLLRKATAVRIGDARDGELVKVVGRLRYTGDEDPLQAPLTERFGAHFEVEVEERKSRGKSSYWKQIVRERASHQQVWLEGHVAGERVLVDLAFAEVELVMDGHFSSGFLDDPSPHLDLYLHSHGHASQGAFFNKSLRYREGVLEQGEQIAVLGRCVVEPDPDPTGANQQAGYRGMATRRRIVPPEEHALLVTDDPALL
jgi:hypothetical protein